MLRHQSYIGPKKWGGGEERGLIARESDLVTGYLLPARD